MIAPTLDSVLNQCYQDFEVIIVDDCSSDIAELEAVIKHFNDNRVRLIKHESNLNGAAARNTGIKAATGKYIAFLDSDDVWPISRLKIVADEIKCTDASSNTIFYGQVDFKFPEERTGIIKPTNALGNMQVAEYLFLHNGLIQTSTIVCSRVLAHKIGFDERFVRHQDYDFCIRAQAIGAKFHFIQVVLSHWLRHKGANVINKGAKVDFCLFWLKEMSKYMSSREQAAYLIKVLFPISIESGKFKIAYTLLVSHFTKLPISITLKSLYAGCKAFVKYLLRKVK